MGTNQVTADYLDRCGVPGDPLRDAVRRAPYVAGFTRGTGAGLLARPLFVTDSAIRAGADGMLALHELIASLPHRLFDGDMRRYCEAVGADERSTRVACLGGMTTPPPYGRADMLFDGLRWWVAEMNIGSELGGAHIGEMNRAMLQLPEFRAFAQEHRLINVDPTAEIAAMLRRVAEPVTGGTRAPVVAVLEWTGGFATVPFLYKLFQDTVSAHGVPVHLAEATQVVNKDGKIYLDSEPIDIVLRYFMLHEVCGDPNGEEIIEPILRAHDEGGTILFTHPQTNIYSYKDNLALLSDPRYRDSFTAAEGELIDRFLPWTRLVDDVRTEADGEIVDLPAYCLAHKDQLIAKPHGGYGAHGTAPGWQVSDEQWAEVIAKRPPHGYVVQRRVDSELERMIDPETGESQDWRVVHGVFYTDAGYAGNYGRALPVDGSAVVSGNTGAFITGVLSYPG